MSTLSERAMLSSLHISMWSATRTDKKASAEIADTHAISTKRAGHYRKHAINVEAPSFKAVRAAGAVLRVRHYYWTLPWAADGVRILPAANFDKYSQEMRALRSAFGIAANEFIRDYPALKAAARSELNGLYDENDYPKRIAGKFAIDHAILPWPEAADFRANLPQGDLDEIRRGITEEMERTTALAMRDPYERLYSHISRMVKQLSNPEGIIRETLVTGLAELCTVLPGLNIANDANLEDMRKRAESLVVGLDATCLRDHPGIRADVAKRATEIQDLMAAFMGEP
jgi:hypothetical protein